MDGSKSQSLTSAPSWMNASFHGNLAALMDASMGWRPRTTRISSASSGKSWPRTSAFGAPFVPRYVMPTILTETLLDRRHPELATIHGECVRPLHVTGLSKWLVSVNFAVSWQRMIYSFHNLKIHVFLVIWWQLKTKTQKKKSWFQTSIIL